MADRNEIIDALDSLAVHCRPPLMTIDDRSRWMADWCKDLASFPAESIRIACDRWRNGQDRKFPMPGQLIPLVRAVTVKGDGASTAPKVWGPVSDAEYEAMSLRDKARHQSLLALDATNRAGPQWRNKTPIPAEDMPQEWHDLHRKAANHHAEAARLMTIVRERREA
ncbi:MAG: hypothetical protein WAW13_00680 [Minisyncoccia bacterium]